MNEDQLAIAIGFAKNHMNQHKLLERDPRREALLQETAGALATLAGLTESSERELAIKVIVAGAKTKPKSYFAPAEYTKPEPQALSVAA